MYKKFNGITVEMNGVRAISGGGTNADSATGALANLGGYPISNPSGFITGIDTSNFYTNDNPSGYITGIENLVYTTGDQTISGIKTFEQGLEVGSMLDLSTLYVLSGAVGINNENPQAALDVSGSARFSERPFVNGTGVVLIGEINTSNFYTNDNPSGYITGIENLVYTTGDQTISGVKIFNNDIYIKSTGTNPAVLYVESGRIGINNEYPQASLDVSGSVFFSERPLVNSVPFMLSGDINTGNFYTNDNPSGFITGIENLVYTTGDQNISGVKNFIQRPTVNGTGVVLEGEVQNNTIISGVLYSAQVNIKNNHTGTLYKGQPVYINGAAGGNILVGLASNVAESTSSKTLGLIYQDSLAVNAFGTVITDGLLSNFNVGSAAAGDPIWLGPTGNLIYGLTNKPVAPNHLVYLGVVTKTNNNGEVFVKVQNGYELDELHDVAVKNSPTGQFLFKNIESLWSGKYLQISDVSGLESSLNQKQTAGDYYLNSNPSGFISSNIVGLSGATQLVNIVQITQSGYNTIVSPATGTLYIIVG